MNEIAFFVLGLALGGLAMWFFISGARAWKTARGLIKAPAKAKEKYEGEKKKARGSVAKGRRQYMWSILYFVGGVAVVGVIIFFIFTIM